MEKTEDPKKMADELYNICIKHIYWKRTKDYTKENYEDILYRIYYYDCKPFGEKVYHPILQKTVDFSKTPQYNFRVRFFEQLKSKRKIALRLGELKGGRNWVLRTRVFNDLIHNKKSIKELTDNDVHLDLRQKTIDIKIGIDIAQLALKKLVRRIVLISGDSDFVPAAKLARMEGIDFILDPMWNNVDKYLLEHIDGLRSTCKKQDFTS